MTVSIIDQGGGEDYTTISAWEAAADVTSSPWEGIISDNSNYFEFVTISGVTGTPTMSNYVKLTVDPANRHAGFIDATKARIDLGTTSFIDIVDILEDYTWIEWLQIESNSSTNFDVSIYIQDVTDVLIDYCVVRMEGGGDRQAGVLMGYNSGSSASISNTVFERCTEASILIETSGSVENHTLNLDHVTVARSALGPPETADGGIVAHVQNASSTINVNANNCYAQAEGSDPCWLEVFSAAGTINWTGSHNACDDFTLSTIGLFTGAQQNLTITDVSQSSGDFAVFNDVTGVAANYTLLDTELGNKLFGLGVNRIGSEPDARQDFSLSIEGNTRSPDLIDIGASQISVGGAGTPNVSLIIQAGGGDYTSISGWEAAADIRLGRWEGVISDSENYFESAVFSGVVGTPSIDRYAKLTVDAAHRHAGFYDATKARIDFDTMNGPPLSTLSDDYSMLQWMQLRHSGNGSAQTGIDFNNSDNLLVDYCLIRMEGTGTLQNGVEIFDTLDNEISMSNTIIESANQRAVNIVAVNANPNALVCNFDHLTLVRAARNPGAPAQAGAIYALDVGTGPVTINMYNSYGHTEGLETAFDPATPLTWVGTNNACDDTSLTTIGLTSGAQQSLVNTSTSQASGSFAVFKDITLSGADYTLLDDLAGNLLASNGVDRIGSEPDPRQNFALSIEGNTREPLAIDIGASQFFGVIPPAAGGPAVVKNIVSSIVKTDILKSKIIKG